MCYVFVWEWEWPYSIKLMGSYMAQGVRAAILAGKNVAVYSFLFFLNTCKEGRFCTDCFQKNR